MKKWTLLLVCMLLLCAVSPALANSWGVSGGELLGILVKDHSWDDYTSVGTPAGDIAVLGTRYHNVLMIPENGALHTYTKAVYQPDDDMPGPKITVNETGFSLRYSDECWFTFVKADGVYKLHLARVNGMSIRSTDNDYRFIATHDDGITAVINRRYWLEDFNISLFPQTINEIRHLNWMREALDSESFVSYTLETLLDGPGSGSTPVLSAPFEGAWRAAKGKAAVGLSGEMWKLFAFCNQDGEEYWAIRYDVSLRTQRIGYVKRSALDGSTAQPWEETEITVNVPLTVIQETYLTDDPDVSQFAQFTLPVNTVVNCMGLYNEDYAYVATATDGGQNVWGFVPLRDLQTSHSYGAVSDTAVMQQLAGHWEFWAGGLSVGDYLTLNEDGSYETYMFSADDPYSYLPDTTGTWSVTPYSPGYGLYWNDPVYEITFFNDNGTVDVHGLNVQNDNEFSITFWEGGGGYQRIDALPGNSEGNG